MENHQLLIKIKEAKRNKAILMPLSMLLLGCVIALLFRVQRISIPDNIEQPPITATAQNTLKHGVTE